MSDMDSPPDPSSLSTDRPNCFVCNRTSDYITAAQLVGLLIIYSITTAYYSLQKKNIYLELPGWFDCGKYLWAAATITHIVLKICIDGGNFQSNVKTKPIVDENESWIKAGLVWVIGMSIGKALALWLAEKMLLRFLSPVEVEEEEMAVRWGGGSGDSVMVAHLREKNGDSGK